MLKSPILFVLSLLIIIVNNVLFGAHEINIMHIIQIIIGIVLCFHFTWSMLNLSADFFPKKYEIALFIAFIFMARSTESIIRKYLTHYFPEFYQEYRLFIFALAIVIFLGVVYFLQKSISKRQVKTD